jgi:hypothetical protein
VVPSGWPDELGIELVDEHGGSAARDAVGRPAPTERSCAVRSASFAVQVRCSCAREVGEKWRGGVRPTERVTPVSSAETPASHYRGWRPNPSGLWRAPDAPWKGAARAKTEAEAVSRSGG